MRPFAPKDVSFHRGRQLEREKDARWHREEKDAAALKVLRIKEKISEVHEAIKQQREKAAKQRDQARQARADEARDAEA